MENNVESSSHIYISLGFIIVMAIAWGLSFLINTFLFTISFLETYGILMFGLSVTVVAKEFYNRLLRKYE